MKRFLAALGTATLAATLAIAATAPAHATTAAQKTALAAARSQKGDRYSTANPQGPNHWDCSGLVRYAFGKAGKKLPRVAKDQYNAVRHISPANRQAGDIIFISLNGRIYHAGVFAGVRGGKGYMVNANTGKYRGRKVVEAPVTEYTKGAPVAKYGRP